ncbi:MAG: SIMPL domain-containing protein [Caulobacteraceae bacterium]
MKTSPIMIVAALALALPLGPAVAQTADPAFAATTLRLTAYGEARAQPDMATVTLGVETTASTAGGAMRTNAERMTRVLGALERAGIAGRDLQTSSLGLAPQYVYEQNQPPRLTGYQASNQLTVTVRDLTRIGPIADAVVGAGATNVGQIVFGLSAPVASEDSARVAAVKALDDKAALYAKATGYQIKRLVSLSEGADYQPAPRPMAMMAMRGEGAAGTPVQSGELKVRVDVTGIFELTR